MKKACGSTSSSTAGTCRRPRRSSMSDRWKNAWKTFSGQGLDYRIASGGGRMVTTMDRYEADWNIVKRGWEAHVLGTARPFEVAHARPSRPSGRSRPGVTDQYLPSFTIVDENGPVGTIDDGDSVIFFNFRGDRAIEMSRAFEEDDFSTIRPRAPSPT